MVPILKSYDKILTTKNISFIVNTIEVTKWEDQHGHLQVQAHEILVRFQEARSICTLRDHQRGNGDQKVHIVCNVYMGIYIPGPPIDTKTIKLSQFSCSSELVPFSG